MVKNWDGSDADQTTQADLVKLLVKDGRLKTAELIEVYTKVDRAFFLPAELPSEKVYCDTPLTMQNCDVHQSAPHMYAIMLEQLKLQPGMSFLNVGSGTGYLSTLAAFFTGTEGVNHGIEWSASNTKLAKDAVGKFLASAGVYAPVKFTHANAFHLDVEKNIKYGHREPNPQSPVPARRLLISRS